MNLSDEQWQLVQPLLPARRSEAEVPLLLRGRQHQVKDPGSFGAALRQAADTSLRPTAIEQRTPPLSGAPPQVGQRGRPPVDQRQILNGILWRLAARRPWRKIPASYPSSQVCFHHYCNWMKAGLMRKVIFALMTDLKTRGQFDLRKALTTGMVKIEKKKGRIVVYIQSQFTSAWQIQTALLYYQFIACHMERTQGLRNFQPDPLEEIFQKE